MKTREIARPRGLVAGAVGLLSLAGAFIIYFVVTFAPEQEFKRLPMCFGLIMTWAGASLIESPADGLHRIGCVVMLAGMLATLAMMLW